MAPQKAGPEARRTTAQSAFDGSLRKRLEQARDTAAVALLRERNPAGGWTGELSASALSTATAVAALTIVARGDPATADRLRKGIRQGYQWLIEHQNQDGGWGDTTKSFSNISTTALVWAAFGIVPEALSGTGETVAAAERWLKRAAGSLEPDRVVNAIERRYGNDRTFSIPILTLCVLCGRLGPEPEAWRHVRQLPFELAALPPRCFGALRLPVVSYALPALIAIGQVRHGRRPTKNPLWRALRDRCRAGTLERLGRLQPANGGFLEAAPLTSFVTMSLAALGHARHPVVRRGVAFLEASARPDGSWPIDTNLATWLTTLAVNALDAPSGGSVPPAASDLAGLDAGSAAVAQPGPVVRDWLLGQQYRNEHPYTLAAPGGWAWTDLPGGVPDADDTAGALLALHRLGPDDHRVRPAAEAGVGWLLGLQNRDGGIPTFCRGWGRLPFDRSSPDLTAHAIQAWMAWRFSLSTSVQRRLDTAVGRATVFLLKTQREDGVWIPLWFGHQEDPNDENPIYGTARVVPALCVVEFAGTPGTSRALDRALHRIAAKQNTDGGWSGASGAASSMEETGLALDALAAGWERQNGDVTLRQAMQAAMVRGGAWLVGAIENKAWHNPAPIGFYFAKLWYHERLYPLIFAVAALTRLTRLR